MVSKKENTSNIKHFLTFVFVLLSVDKLTNEVQQERRGKVRSKNMTIYGKSSVFEQDRYNGSFIVEQSSF